MNCIVEEIKMSAISKIRIPARTVYECNLCHTQYQTRTEAEVCASHGIDPLKPGFVYGLDADPFRSAGIVLSVSDELYPVQSGDLHTRSIRVETCLFFPEKIASRELDRLFRLIDNRQYNSEFFRGGFQRGRYHLLTEEQREQFLTFVRLEQEGANTYFRLLAGLLSDDQEKTIENLLYFDDPFL